MAHCLHLPNALMAWVVCGITSMTMLQVIYFILQAIKSDISAVASLKDVLPYIDSPASMLLSCSWLPGVVSSCSGMLPLEATRHKRSSPMVVDLRSAAAVDLSAAVADLSIAVTDMSPAVVDALAADAGGPLAATAALSANEGPCMLPVTPVGIFSAADSSAVAAAETLEILHRKVQAAAQ